MTAGYHRQVQNVVRDAGWLRRELFDSILEGYGLIQNRLAPGDEGRADRAHPLRRARRSTRSG